MKTLILKVELHDNHLAQASGPVRDLEVRESASLYRLAEAIAHAYGFDFDHAFGFFNRTGNDFLSSERKYELFADMEEVAAEHPDSVSVERTHVGDVWKILGDSMTFLFDYGDMWRFTITLVGLGKVERKRRYPRVVRREGDAPEQYPE